MKKMTPEECRSFLASLVRTGKLATVRKDGRPHVVEERLEGRVTGENQ